MEQEFYLGGYFWVIPSPRPDCMDLKLVPPKIITVCNCICDIMPDYWALDWTKDKDDEMEKSRVFLKLTTTEIQELVNWVTVAFENGDFGWPNGFSSLESAHEFREKFMKNVEEAYLLSIGLEKNDAEFFITEEYKEGIGEALIYSKIKSREKMKLENLLGYDILGFDICSFESYLCNVLEKEIENTFSIGPNQYGYFDDYSKASEAAEYLMRDDVNAEPALWQAWAVCLIEKIV